MAWFQIQKMFSDVKSNFMIRGRLQAKSAENVKNYIFL